MSMPGFTAEKSLSQASRPYRAKHAGTIHGATVVPQLQKGGGVSPALECLAACFCCGRYGSSFCCILCDICTVILSNTGGIATGILR